MIHVKYSSHGPIEFEMSEIGPNADVSIAEEICGDLIDVSISNANLPAISLNGFAPVVEA